MLIVSSSLPWFGLIARVWSLLWHWHLHAHTHGPIAVGGFCNQQGKRKLPSIRPYFVFSQQLEAVSQSCGEAVLVEKEPRKEWGSSHLAPESSNWGQNCPTTSQALLKDSKRCCVHFIDLFILPQTIQIQDLYIFRRLVCLNDHWGLKEFWNLQAPAVLLTYWLLWGQIFSAARASTANGNKHRIGFFSGI